MPKNLKFPLKMAKNGPKRAKSDFFFKNIKIGKNFPKFVIKSPIRRSDKLRGKI